MLHTPFVIPARATKRVRIFAGIMLAALAMLPATSQAQDQPLLKSGAHRYGGFGGPAFQVTSVAGETMPMGTIGGAF